MAQNDKTDHDLHFDNYPVPLDWLSAYTRKHSLKVAVQGQYGLRIVLKLLLWLAQSLSWQWAYRVGQGIGLLLYTFRLRRKIAMVNLDIVFGETKSHKEKLQIYKASLINCGRVVINYLRIPFMGESFWSEHVIWEGEERFRSAMNQKKGALLLSGHLGMMDLAGGKIGMSGYPIAVVGKRIKNPVINRFLIETRNAMNLGTIAHRDSMKRILDGIGRGEAVAMAVDQNMKSKQGIFIDWMGRAASSIRSGAYVVKKTGAPVLVGFMVQLSPDRFEIVATEEVPWENYPDSLEKELLINTQHQSNAFQKFIFKYPELWFWIHQRYKRQPDGVPNPYK